MLFNVDTFQMMMMMMMMIFLKCHCNLVDVSSAAVGSRSHGCCTTLICVVLYGVGDG